MESRAKKYLDEMLMEMRHAVERLKKRGDAFWRRVSYGRIIHRSVTSLGPHGVMVVEIVDPPRGPALMSATLQGSMMTEMSSFGGLEKRVWVVRKER